VGKFVKGEVVVVPFPFSDLSGAKRRPALVVAALTGDDVILCQITSQSVADQYAIPISRSDFSTRGLQKRGDTETGNEESEVGESGRQGDRGDCSHDSPVSHSPTLPLSKTLRPTHSLTLRLRAPVAEAKLQRQ
jgi:hypothetical protein